MFFLIQYEGFQDFLYAFTLVGRSNQPVTTFGTHSYLDMHPVLQLKQHQPC